MQRLVIIVLVVFVVLAFMTTYTVRFTETAVVTTFGKADTNSVQDTPGIRFKVPYVQRVTKYDKRARYLESNPETEQTADNQQVVVTSYVTWRVSNPLLFYQSFSGSGDRAADHYRAAEGTVRLRLRSAMAEASRFRLDELLSADSGGSRLEALEKQIQGTLGAKGAAAEEGQKASALSEYGIEPITVAITSVKFPQTTTQAVFARMQANRARIAQAAISEGVARAESIRESAKADAAKIMSFADRLATDTRVLGDQEAAQFLARQNESPELAVFIERMKFLREGLSGKTTLVLPTSLPGFDMFRFDAMDGLKAGQIPPFNVTRPGTSTAPLAGAAPAGAAVPAAGGR